MSKSLFAYFSASSVTAKVTENPADAIGADIFEIQPEVPYTKADLNWMGKKARSTIEMSDLHKSARVCHLHGENLPLYRKISATSPDHPSTKKLCRQSHRQSSEIPIFYFGYWNIVQL
jgi:hypothetical protein